MSTLINTHAFDYINVLDKAADASWLRNEAIANNIANVDTPYYKMSTLKMRSTTHSSGRIWRIWTVRYTT